MTRADAPSESHSVRGTIDRKSMIEFRDEVETIEPLASAQLDDFVDPDELRITLGDGIGSSSEGRFDVTWSTVDDYHIHYTDDLGRNFRWDVHEHSFPAPSDDSHFHPPPRASSSDSDVEASCIDVTPVELVARATMKLWRVRYDAGTIGDPNSLDDPP